MYNGLITDVIGIGLDLIEVNRMQKVASRIAFMEKVYTDREREYFKSRNDNLQVLAGTFAAKEAVSKALGTGFRSFQWTDIEILRDHLGKPVVILHGRAAELFQTLGGHSVLLSITHTSRYAAAQAVIQ